MYSFNTLATAAPPCRSRRIALAAALALPPAAGRLPLQTGMGQVALVGPHRRPCGFAPARSHHHIPLPSVSAPSVRRLVIVGMGGRYDLARSIQRLTRRQSRAIDTYTII